MKSILAFCLIASLVFALSEAQNEGNCGGNTCTDGQCCIRSVCQSRRSEGATCGGILEGIRYCPCGPGLECSGTLLRRCRVSSNSTTSSVTPTDVSSAPSAIDGSSTESGTSDTAAE